MNKELFKYFQALNRDTNKTLAEALGMHEVTLSNKLNEGGKAAFSRPEIEAISARWKLSLADLGRIFFDLKMD